MDLLTQAILVTAFLSGFVLVPLLVARWVYPLELRRTLKRASENPGKWALDLSQDRPSWMATCAFAVWFMLAFVLLGFPWFCAIPISAFAILATAFRFGRLNTDFQEPKAAWCKFYLLEPARFGEKLMKALEDEDLGFRYNVPGKRQWVWPPMATITVDLSETVEAKLPAGERRGFWDSGGSREKQRSISFQYGSLERDGLKLTMLSMNFYDMTGIGFNPLYDGNIRKRFLDLVDENIREVYKQPLV